MADPEEAQAALVGGISLIEEGKFPLLVKPGFDEVFSLEGWDLIGGKFEQASSGGAEHRFCEPVGEGVGCDEGLDFCGIAADLGGDCVAEKSAEFEAEFF